jgi:hypothetical protein
MRDCHDLNLRWCELPVNHDERELPEQESAGGMWTRCPTSRSLTDVCKRPIHLGIKLDSSVRTLLQVPVKHRVIFGSGFLVKVHRISGHWEALPNCASGLPTMKWFLPCQSPDRLIAFRSPLPKPLEGPRQLFPRGWKSANQPMLLVPQLRATMLALTTCKLPLSSAPCSAPLGFIVTQLMPPSAVPQRLESPIVVVADDTAETIPSAKTPPKSGR